MELIKKIFNKICTREVISYLIFGVLTTLVNIVSLYLLVYIVGLEENLSNTISIIISVLFAYVTNSIFVFQTKFTSLKEKFAEFFKFILGRAFTMVFEMLGFFVMFSLLHIDVLISKVFITFVVIILNYFVSKFFAFKKA